jgi:hypothetical protein
VSPVHSLGTVRNGAPFRRLFREWVISNAFECCDLITSTDANITNSLQFNLDLSEVCQFVYERLVSSTSVHYNCVSTSRAFQQMTTYWS